MIPNIFPYLIAIVVLLIVVGAVLLFLKAKLDASDASAAVKVKPRKLLTSNETEFYNRLVAALPEHRVMAQVSMGALLDPAVPRGDKAYMSIRGRFSQKVVDYVICNSALEVVAVVELDDRTHNAVKDAQRDQLLAAAGYKTVRFDSRTKPSPEQIRTAIVS